MAQASVELLLIMLQVWSMFQCEKVQLAKHFHSFFIIGQITLRKPWESQFPGLRESVVEVGP